MTVFYSAVASKFRVCAPNQIFEFKGTDCWKSKVQICSSPHAFPNVPLAISIPSGPHAACHFNENKNFKPSALKSNNNNKVIAAPCYKMDLSYLYEQHWKVASPLAISVRLSNCRRQKDKEWKLNAYAKPMTVNPDASEVRIKWSLLFQNPHRMLEGIGQASPHRHHFSSQVNKPLCFWGPDLAIHQKMPIILEVGDWVTLSD